MLVEYMIPCYVVHLDEMALGIANLSDDMALSDASRLGAPADESPRDASTSESRSGREPQTAHETAHGPKNPQQPS